MFAEGPASNRLLAHTSTFFSQAGVIIPDIENNNNSSEKYSFLFFAEKKAKGL